MDNSIGARIAKYIKKDKRTHRVLLSLSEDELLTLKRAAEIIDAPIATFARAACMLGTVGFLQTKDGPHA